MTSTMPHTRRQKPVDVHETAQKYNYIPSIKSRCMGRIRGVGTHLKARYRNENSCKRENKHF